MDDEMLKLMARINISSYRLKTVKALKDGDKIPSQIAKDADIRINHISSILKELKELGIVVCLNEEDKRNRIYQLTPTGRQIADYLD
ncbi:MAG: winged helix-turn-helix transcriptional regulator [Methanobrevibacter sp.]|nr:winged helix-turn-helix transcriptional regulator [Methanobrevibacter sp.]